MFEAQGSMIPNLQGVYSNIFKYIQLFFDIFKDIQTYHVYTSQLQRMEAQEAKVAIRVLQVGHAEGRSSDQEDRRWHDRSFSFSWKGWLNPTEM